MILSLDANVMQSISSASTRLGTVLISLLSRPMQISSPVELVAAFGVLVTLQALD